MTGCSSITEGSEFAAWDGAPEVERSAWEARPGLVGDRADTGRLVEGLRIWNLGMASRGDVSRVVRAVFWVNGLVGGGTSEGPGAGHGSSRRSGSWGEAMAGWFSAKPWWRTRIMNGHAHEG